MISRLNFHFINQRLAGKELAHTLPSRFLAQDLQS